MLAKVLERCSSLFFMVRLYYGSLDIYYFKIVVVLLRIYETVACLKQKLWKVEKVSFVEKKMMFSLEFQQC